MWNFYSCLFTVQYITVLYRYLREWWKDPHCSFSCCLAWLLPLNDLQGKIHGLAATDALNSQMQSGQMDAPTLIGAVKDSGAIDASLEQGQKDDHATFAIQGENCQDPVYNNNQSHKKTQTEMYTLFTAVKGTHLWISVSLTYIGKQDEISLQGLP